MRKTIAAAMLLTAALCQPALCGFKIGLVGAVKGKVEQLDKKTAKEYFVPVSANTPPPVIPGLCDPARMKWCKQGDIFYYSAPAIGDDGTIYAGTSKHFVWYFNYWNKGLTPPTTGFGLLAMNPADGSEKWRALTGKPARGGAVIAPDGTIYMVFENLGSALGDTREDLYAITSTGTVKWIYQGIGGYWEIGGLTPALAADGTIYVQGSRLWAFNPDGTRKWDVSNGDPYEYVIFSSPVVGPDGTIYAVCWPTEETICAYAPDGTRLWRGPNLTTYPITSSPVIGADGTVYIGAHDDHGEAGPLWGNAFFAISSGAVTGSLKWAFSTGNGDVRASASIDTDGTLYFGTKGGYTFYAVNPDGTQKWSYNFSADGGPGIEGDVYNSAAIGADGSIYFANELGAIFAMNPDGTVKWKHTSGAQAINWSSPAIAADGTMYMGTTYGYFYAVKTDSLGLKTSAQWPKFRVDNKNTGRR